MANLSQDTPYSRGSGSHSAYERQHTRAAYAEYLREDIRTQREMPFRDALSIILNLKEDEWAEGTALRSTFEQIANKKSFLDFLRSYRTQTSERARYEWFVKMVNLALDQLASKHDESKGNSAGVSKSGASGNSFNLRVCRNDPRIMLGSNASRSPDCSFLWRHILNRGSRKSNPLFKPPPEGCGFHWFELLAFLEFKLEDADIQEELTNTVSSQHDVLTHSGSKSQALCSHFLLF